MSKLIFWGSTALDAYQHCSDRCRILSPSASLRLGLQEPENLAPNAAAIQYAQEQFPWLSPPFHVVVPTRRQRRGIADVRCHLMEPSLQQGPYFHLAQGIFAPSPEVAFLQSSWGKDLVDVAFEGSTLCGAYGLDPGSDMVRGRIALASADVIRGALLTHRDIRGCAMARRALPWILENAASPREVALALVMTLPNHLGGYHFTRPSLNYVINLDSRGRPLSRKRHYVADICWPAQRLILEYDSDERHLSTEQLQEDAVKRMTLEAMGYKIITVGRLQLNSVSETRKIALAVARTLGEPIRFRIADFDTKHERLRRAVGLPSW